VAQERAEAELAEQNAQDSSAPADPKAVLEFDDTSEFVRSITYTPAPVVPSSSATASTPTNLSRLPVKQEPIIVQINTGPPADDDDSDTEMGEVDEAIIEMDTANVKAEDMEEDETEAMLSAIEDAIKKSEEAKKEAEDDGVVGFLHVNSSY
jgi:U4/U6.U5 tri-snRNP-associated protein 1